MGVIRIEGLDDHVEDYTVRFRVRQRCEQLRHQLLHLEDVSITLVIGLSRLRGRYQADVVVFHPHGAEHSTATNRDLLLAVERALRDAEARYVRRHSHDVHEEGSLF